MLIDSHPTHPPSFTKKPLLSSLLWLLCILAGRYSSRWLIAILLTFAPIPARCSFAEFGWDPLDRPAVVAVVIGAFAAIFFVRRCGRLTTWDTRSKHSALPIQSPSLRSKSLKDANVGGGVLERLSKVAASALGREIQAGEKRTRCRLQAQMTRRNRLYSVEVITPPPGSTRAASSVIGPPIQPLATGGIIIVVVIFMLLRREDMRDRFIRLVGPATLHRTTRSFAGCRRASRPLSVVAAGGKSSICSTDRRWPLIIGVPNAPLWGLWL